MSQFAFVLINEAKTSPLAAQITPDVLGKMAAAITIQLNRDFAPHWGGSYMVRVGSGPTDLIKGEVAFAILDALPDAPGAIAYHDVDGNAIPVAFLSLSTCNTLADVSMAISHECIETGTDPGCNLWADDGAGTEWAYEGCDAVESSSYQIDEIVVSDFVLPQFFVKNGQGPYSFMNTAPAPFTCGAGGYQIKRVSGTGESQVTGDLSSKRGLKVASGAHHWSSRPARRGVKIQWLRHVFVVPPPMGVSGETHFETVQDAFSYASSRHLEVSVRVFINDSLIGQYVVLRP